MEAEGVIAWAGVAYLAAGGLMLVASVRRGRALCRRFAERLPERYAEAGRPRPGYFDSARRSAYFRFVLQEGFADLEDPALVADFAELRRMEFRQLVFLVGGLAGFGLAFVWLEWLRGS